ncbi:MAG: tetratricopeptide repeat protein [Burkholderiales bacterium]|nr:tetratricopeptide repeat protein [Burkholderiales bacterium]
MSRIESVARRAAVGHARAASAAESRGDTNAAIDAWTAAAGADPAWAPARVGLGQALLRAGRASDADPVLERAVALAPGDAGAWLALGVARATLGRHDAAIAAGERACTLAPQLAGVHLGQGDVLRVAGRSEAARAAYRRAVDLAPANPDGLNKLGVAERNAYRLDEARALLDRALAADPRHPEARVNRASVDVLAGRLDAARGRLAAALADPAVRTDARTEALSITERLLEESALDAAIAASVAAADPAVLRRALDARGAGTSVDRALVDELAALAAGAPADADAGYAALDALDERWPSIEAHFNLRAGEDLAAVVASVRGGTPLSGPEREDFHRYAALVARRSTLPLPIGDGPGCVAWLRYVHAELTGHRPECLPGHFKPVANEVPRDERPRRTPPSEVTATLSHALGNLAPRVPAGGARAAFVMYAIASIHPFQEANGRTLRYAINAVLEARGLHPQVFPRSRHEPESPQIFAALRRERGLRPMAEWLADGSRNGARVAAEVTAVLAR